MKCPICVDESLVMMERRGIEIDYCQKCRGVWLDRGELDKIIERSASVAPAQPQPASNPEYRDAHHHSGDYRSGSHRSDEYRSDDYGYRKKKKGSLLGELFDF